VEESGKDLGGVTRSQNVVFVVSHDWASISYFLAPLIERIDEKSPDLQVLVLAADAEAAAAISGAAVRLASNRNVGIIAATSAPRTTRLLKTLAAHIVVGDPSTIVDLVRGSALKLSGVRAVAFAWADSMLAETDAEEAIATIMADIPKEAARTIATTEVTPAVESLIERYARRARRVTSAATADTTPIAIEYISTAESARSVTLRRMLDALDLDNAAIFVRGESSAAEAGVLIRSLGYAGEKSPVKLSHGGGTPTSVILYDLPASREELAEAMGASARRVIALIQPRQLSSLRTLAGGGQVKPLTLPDAGKRLRSRDEATRAELRAVLDRGAVTRTLFAIEPLLEEYDAVDIAAAALALLEDERAKPRVVEAKPEAAQDGFTRLFFSVGARDGLRVGEVVATIGNDGGVPSSQIGKVDIRDTHAIVEVAPAVSQQVIDKLTGKTMSGRRLIVRPDQSTGDSAVPVARSREGGPRREGGKGGPRREGGARSGGFRSERPSRGDAPSRPRSPAGRPRPDRPRGGGEGR
jgi:ATP-dependent RNA helicase DeaD